MGYCVYVLFSECHNKIYIGFTSDLISRFKSHNELGTKNWTHKFRPWMVIHVEMFQDKATGLKRESALKGGQGRAWIHQKLLNEYTIKGFISDLGEN